MIRKKVMEGQGPGHMWILTLTWVSHGSWWQKVFWFKLHSRFKALSCLRTTVAHWAHFKLPRTAGFVLSGVNDH